MDLSRIKHALDTVKTQRAHVTAFGAGASTTLLGNLARCGIEQFTLSDPDRIEPVNIARQGHREDQIGRFKVDAVAEMIRAINPRAEVTTLPMDCTVISDAEIEENFSGTDLFLFLTDRFTAQAWGNTLALRFGTPALWGGLYAGGFGGEIIFWHAEIDACFRCLCSKRYQAHAAAEETTSLDPSSDGATIFDVAFLDAVAGMVALGLLTRGSDNRFGRLIDDLGDRNFLQLSTDPGFRIAGRDVIAEQLGISDQCDTYFAWNTIARRDPDGGQLYCSDCERYRGHRFEETPRGFVRIKPGETGTVAPKPTHNSETAFTAEPETA
jgi:molybdopterin/thiamine biosynthesis adenylyltransferase